MVIDLSDQQEYFDPAQPLEAYDVPLPMHLDILVRNTQQMHYCTMCREWRLQLTSINPHDPEAPSLEMTVGFAHGTGHPIVQIPSAATLMLTPGELTDVATAALAYTAQTEAYIAQTTLQKAA